MTNRFTLTMLFLLIISAVLGQVNNAFKPGEKLKYNASYNMKGIMTDIAGIDLEVYDVPGKNVPVNRLVFTANTYTSWDGYVKVRHAYQTFIEANTVKPMLMKQDSDVKGNITKAKYTFKSKSNIANIEVINGTAPAIKKHLPISNKTFDIVSLIYYSRNINFGKIKPGQKLPISVLFMERILNIELKYIGKETIKVDKMGAKECYKVALVLEHKFIVEPNVTFIWFTTDKNQVPVLISTIFKEGKALVKLADYSNLKY